LEERQSEFIEPKKPFFIKIGFPGPFPKKSSFGRHFSGSIMPEKCLPISLFF
jgi:hypothetical protein